MHTNELNSKEKSFVSQALTQFMAVPEKNLCERVATKHLKKQILARAETVLDADEGLLLNHILREVRDVILPTAAMEQRDKDISIWITTDMSDGEKNTIIQEATTDANGYIREQQQLYSRIMGKIASAFPEWSTPDQIDID